MCVVRARGAHLSRHQPPVEKFKCLRVYPKNVHQPWPLALKLHLPYQANLYSLLTGAGDSAAALGSDGP